MTMKRFGTATTKAYQGLKVETLERNYPVQPPMLPNGVVPKGKRAPALAMDGPMYGYGGAFAVGYGDIAGFPGYPYLAGLATRAEYRGMASALASEMTREWITLNSSETDDDATKEKLTLIKKRLQDLKVQQVIQQACEQDAYFGCSHIVIDVGAKNPDLPLILSPKTIAKGSLKGFKCVEPLWTTPSTYNALNPASPDFYKPKKWFVMGVEYHASRLMTLITRPLPDMLKPAFNFGGMSLSQLAEPYVNNWLRTRQAVSDLINNFSITVLKTSMSQVLQGGEGPECDGQDLFARADLFTAGRANKGLMLIDRETEDVANVSTSLAGLDELQAQAQEHMCSVSRMPAIILTGISPSGLNASSEGEIRVWYDWVASQQEAYYRWIIDTILKVIQLDMFGEIDEDITFTFEPLYQMTAKELAEIRKSDAEAATSYASAGAIDPQEIREKLARDPESGYEGLDLSVELVDVNPNDEDEA